MFAYLGVPLLLVCFDPQSALDSLIATIAPNIIIMEIQDDIDKKPQADYVDDASPTNAGSSKLTVPPLVAAMSQEQRAAAEAKLRRKIDSRLLPMIILMYIMNYLDRNNIAAVRLAGLQDELNLSSVQYQVGFAAPLPKPHYNMLINGRQPFRFSSWDM